MLPDIRPLSIPVTGRSGNRSELHFQAEKKRLAHEENYLVVIVEHRIDYVMDYMDDIFS